MIPSVPPEEKKPEHAIKLLPSLSHSIQLLSCILCDTQPAKIAPYGSAPFCDKCHEKRVITFSVTMPAEDVPSLIEHNLYLTGAANAQNKEVLHHLKIKHILSLINEDPPYPQEFNYKTIRIMDLPTENLGKHFEDICDFIGVKDRKEEAVMVHCGAGVSRSASAVIAYLMKSKGLSLREA